MYRSDGGVLSTHPVYVTQLVDCLGMLLPTTSYVGRGFEGPAAPLAHLAACQQVAKLSAHEACILIPHAVHHLPQEAGYDISCMHRCTQLVGKELLDFHFELHGLL